MMSCTRPSIKLSCASARRMAVSLLVIMSASCFGTGVVDGHPTSTTPSDGLRLGDATLAPPAPTMTRLAVFNNGVDVAEITEVVLPDEAHVGLDTSSCKGFPQVAAQGMCNMELTADGQAQPGEYAVAVRFRQAGNNQEVQAQLTVLPGPLRINDGLPIGLPDQTTQVPVTIVNEGFDLSDVNVVVRCPPGGAGGVSPCVLDAGSCAQGLVANGSCTVLLTSANVAYGAAGNVQAGGKAGVAVAMQPMRSASLTASPLNFARPQTLPLSLVNHGSLPVSLVSVTLEGQYVTGFDLPSGLGLNPITCQNFLGTCNLPVTADADAYMTGGLGVVSVVYRDDVMMHTAVTSLALATGALASCSPSVVTLPANTGQVVVTAENRGQFDWRAPSITLQPPLAGVRVTTTCGSSVPPNSSFTITLATDNTTLEGATVQLVVTGENVAVPAIVPVTIARSLLAVGLSPTSTPLARISYDEGNNWQASPGGMPAGAWEASLLLQDSWVVVGTEGSDQQIYVSRDRGDNWVAASLNAPVQGALYGIAQIASSGLLIAVGADTQATGATYMTSVDEGRTWSPSQTLLTNSYAASAIAVNGVAAVAVGTAVSSSFIATSTNLNTPSWTGLYTGTGVLADVVYTGQAWLAVGKDNNGQYQILRNTTPDADCLQWVSLSGAPSSSYLSAIACSPSGTCVAVGSQGAQQMAITSFDGGASFSAPLTLGNGYLRDVVFSANQWFATGHDAATNAPVILKSADTVQWQRVWQEQSGAALVGIAAR